MWHCGTGPVRHKTGQAALKVVWQKDDVDHRSLLLSPSDAVGQTGSLCFWRERIHTGGVLDKGSRCKDVAEEWHDCYAFWTVVPYDSIIKKLGDGIQQK